MLLPNGLRPQSLDRGSVQPGDIEQGLPSSIYEIFEPWSLSNVNLNIAHRYVPPPVDVAVNDRLRAQSGLFVWWHPPHQQMQCQKFPIIILAAAKINILRAIAPLGLRPEILFPDQTGQRYQQVFDSVI
jgi:hypothetical protein